METRKYKAQEKYDAANAVHVSLKLNKKTDKEILEALSKAENKQAFIKEALRDYIKK